MDLSLLNLPRRGQSKITVQVCFQAYIFNYHYDITNFVVDVNPPILDDKRQGSTAATTIQGLVRAVRKTVKFCNCQSRLLFRPVHFADFCGLTWLHVANIAAAMHSKPVCYVHTPFMK